MLPNRSFIERKTWQDRVHLCTLKKFSLNLLYLMVYINMFFMKWYSIGVIWRNNVLIHGTWGLRRLWTLWYWPLEKLYWDLINKYSEWYYFIFQDLHIMIQNLTYTSWPKLPRSTEKLPIHITKGGIHHKHNIKHLYSTCVQYQPYEYIKNELRW